MSVEKAYEAHCTKHGMLGDAFDCKEDAIIAVKEHIENLCYEGDGDGPSDCRCYIARSYKWRWD